MKPRIPRVLLLSAAVLFCMAVLCSCAGAHARKQDTDIIYPDREPPEPQLLDTVQTEEDVTVPTAETEPVTSGTETEPEPVSVRAETEPVTEPPAPESVRVERFVDRPADEVIPMLEALGLTVETENLPSDRPEGTVQKVSFRGAVGEEDYTISPVYPVVLSVSVGRPARKNVTEKDPKTVYLTFDDGPSPYTPQILETLEKYGVRAAFFMVGSYAALYPKRVKAVSDAGHLIGCHSYTHDYTALYASPDSLLSELDRWENCIRDAIGTVPQTKLFRFPGGSNMSKLTKDAFLSLYWPLHDRGYRCFDWTLADNDRYLQAKPAWQGVEDYLKDSTKTTLRLALLKERAPKIMLMHDSSEETANVLGWIIEYLQGEGYTFGTLDELDGDWTFQ